jgi:hypothetical protein
MLGSLDMMVVYPWDHLDKTKLKKYQNYPTKDAVNKSINSQMAEVSECGKRVWL